MFDGDGGGTWLLSSPSAIRGDSPGKGKRRASAAATHQAQPIAFQVRYTTAAHG